MLTEDEFVALWHAELPGLVRWFTHRTGRWELAEDLAADAYVRAWRARDRWQPTSTPAAWLWTIARRLLLDHWRYASYRRHASLDHLQACAEHAEDIPTSHLWLAALADPAAAAAFDLVDDREVLAAALATCTEGQRTAVLRTHIEGVPQAETAAELDTTVRAVKSLTHRGIVQLRRTLTDQHAAREETQCPCPPRAGRSAAS